MALRILSTAFLLLFAGVIAAPASARSVDVEYTLDQQQSDLRVQLDTDYDTGFPFGIVHLSDNDTQNLGGTINTTLDFGETGSFPNSAEMTINSANIQPLADYNLTLGTLGFNAYVVMSNIVADLASINPPQMLSLISSGTTFEYEFDASGINITLNQGTIAVTGLITASADLADIPLEGTLASGTSGKLYITPTSVNGVFTQIDTQIIVPINLDQQLAFDGQLIDVKLNGTVVANSSFEVSLSDVLADFDDDFDVDADDLTKWENDYNTPGSDADGDGDTDGADFLIWQRQFQRPSGGPRATSVPEPSSICLALLSLCSLAGMTRQKR